MGDRVKDKIAIVTGAGSVGEGVGNGKAAAILYAREGAKIVLADYNLAAAEETKTLIDNESGACITIQADVSKSDDCKRVVEECMKEYGRIDILHNNVGTGIPGGIGDINEEEWDRILDVNLKSVFLMCKYSLPHMKQQGGGVIVNISSINAIRTMPALSGPYGVSKAGMISLTREIATEFASKGIRANAVLPGMLKTPFAVSATLAEAWSGGVTDLVRARDSLCPTGTQGESWDVALASLFLASDDAKYITGTTLVVDGALTSGIKTQ